MREILVTVRKPLVCIPSYSSSYICMRIGVTDKPAVHEIGPPDPASAPIKNEKWSFSTRPFPVQFRE